LVQQGATFVIIVVEARDMEEHVLKSSASLTRGAKQTPEELKIHLHVRGEQPQRATVKSGAHLIKYGVRDA